MFLSAKAFFDDNTNHNKGLLIRMQTEIPADFVRLYRKNVAPITPEATGALKRSIITQVLGNQGTIGWRLPYAAAQNAGGHTVPRTVRGIRKDTGEFGIIPAGYYPYSNGAKGFAFRAFQQTQSEMPANFRARGYIK